MGKNENSLLLVKAFAVGAVLYYLYRVAQENGGTLQGNPLGININGDGVLNLASQFVSPEYRHEAKKIGKEIVNKFMGKV